MGGGGPKNTKTTTKADIPAWITGPAQDYLNQMQGQAGQDVHTFNPNQQQGMADVLGANQAYQGYSQAGLNEMKNLAQNGGQMNPMMQQYMDAANTNLVKNYTQAVAPSQMSGAIQSGAFGGSGDAEARALNQFGLGQNIANNNAAIAYPALQHSMDLQASAASQLPGMAQSVYTPGQTELNIGNQQQQHPYQILQQLGGAISSMAGPFSGSTTISPNLGASAGKF